MMKTIHVYTELLFFFHSLRSAINLQHFLSVLISVCSQCIVTFYGKKNTPDHLKLTNILV